MSVASMLISEVTDPEVSYYRNGEECTETHQTNRKSSNLTKINIIYLFFFLNLYHLKDVFKVDPFGKFYEDPMRRLGVLCKNILLPPDRTHTHTYRQTDKSLYRTFEDSLRTSKRIHSTSN